MPSIMTHAAVAVGAGVLTRLPRRPLAFWVVSVGVSVLPDLDVLAYALGVPHGSMWSHRGITHSLIAAFVTGTLVAILSRRRFFASARTLAIYLSLLMASHGVLDALTEGRAGVAFFAPFSTARYLFPVRPVPAAPLGSRTSARAAFGRSRRSCSGSGCQQRSSAARPRRGGLMGDSTVGGRRHKSGARG